MSKGNIKSRLPVISIMRRALVHIWISIGQGVVLSLPASDHSRHTPPSHHLGLQS